MMETTDSETVAFGEVVKVSKARTSDPARDGIARYVGLEHLESGDLSVRSWGDVTDGTTFTSVFKPGQVLFGKRRAYQRKVAIADFVGVCSSDIYVLEPAGDALLPELLPFLCQSEAFFEYVMSRSQGGLSPRVNWQALSEFRFELPALSEQQEAVQALHAARALVDSLGVLESSARSLYDAWGSHLIGGEARQAGKPSDWCPSEWEIASLGDLVTASICYGIVQVGDDVEGGVPTVAIKDLQGDFQEGLHRTAPEVEGRYARSRVRSGDVLISIKGTIGEIGIAPKHFVGNISRDVARIRLDHERIRAPYFDALYRAPSYRSYVDSHVVGSTRAELSIAHLRRLEVPVPPLAKQDEIVSRMSETREATEKIVRRRESASVVLSSLLDKVFGAHG
jgi:type I restriction enzyme S subunit